MRPTELHVGGTLYWTLLTRDPDTMLLKDADATPTVAVRKNGASVGDSVTITKRSATTGIYDCTYDPAGEVESDGFIFEERAQVTGTTTAQAYYHNPFAVRVIAPALNENGVDNALAAYGSSGVAGADAVQSVYDQVDGLITLTDSKASQTSVTAIGVIVEAIQDIFSGITSLGDWIRRIARKDAGTAGMTNAEDEINTGGTSTFVGTTDNLEAIKDASGGGGGDGAWTEEDVTYALEKLALLGVVADAVVVPAGTFMCGRGDIEQIFGTTAVAKWGDLNNNEDADEITGRINYRIAIADSLMRSTLGNSAWVLPLEGDEIPPILAYYTACLAGVLLYEGRGVQDYDARGNAQHQLSFHKKGVDDFVKGVLFGAVSLAPLEYNVASAAPEAT